MAVSGKKVLVVGASGLVGAAAVQHFAARDDGEVVAVSRRPPAVLGRARFISADLFDDAACAELFGGMSDVTHLVYAALYERADLVSGWRDDEQIAINERMFRNVLDPLIATKGALSHVALLQGTKAYGVHVRRMPVPAREGRDEYRQQPNFYWNQEDVLRDRAADASWNWTILRPVLIVGGSVGGAMNIVPPLGVYASLLKAEGKPLLFPGGAQRIGQMIDTDLLAEVIGWSGETEAAWGRPLNVTNGDMYTWQDLWPAFAAEFGMEPGEPTEQSLENYCRERVDLWDRIRADHDLLAPALDEFVGPSLQYVDYSMRHGETESSPPSLVSTIALQRAGFQGVMDTEDMFRKWFRDLRRRRLLPAVG